ncbi:MAG: hypothetical protein ACI86H_001257 [bacterium]
MDSKSFIPENEKVPVIETGIDAVTVYQNDALILRKGEIHTENGQYPKQIQITNLPVTIDNASVKVQVISSDQSDSSLPTATSIHISFNTFSQTIHEQKSTLDEKIKKLEQEKRKYQIHVKELKKALRRVETLQIHRRPQHDEKVAPSPSPLLTRIALMEFYVQRRNDLRQEKREFDQRLESLGKTLSELKEQQRLSNKNHQPKDNELCKTITIQLDHQAVVSEKAQIVLEYFIYGASWTPVYQIRFADGFGALSLGMKAMVCQQTGEDWKQAHITLSTALKESWREIPKLSSLRIGRLQREKKEKGWKTSPIGSETLYSDYDLFSNDLKRVHSQEKEHEIKGLISETYDEVGFDDFGDDKESGGRVGEVMVGGLPPQEIDEEMDEDLFFADEKKEEEILMAPSPKSKKMAMAPGFLGGGGGYSEPRKKVTLEEQSRSIERGIYTGQSSIIEPQLNYGNLQIPSFTDENRNHLKVVSEVQIYEEIIQRRYVKAQYALEQALPINCKKPFSNDGFDYSFPAENRVDVPSDGNYYSILLSSQQIDAKMHYVLVPREQSDAFRFVSFLNPLHAPLLNGPVDIYIGKEFLMTSHLHTVPIDGEVSLGIGVEQAIKVARNTDYQEKTSGVLSGLLHLNHKVDIEVFNHLDIAANIEIRERIPAVNHEEENVKFEIVDVKPQWKSFYQKENPVEESYHWKIIVPKGESKKCTVSYEIQLPSKYELVGGNQREI